MATKLLAGGDYPRVCGGTAMLWLIAIGLWGLSPRVRGNRGGHPVTGGAGGTIPACAGEPRCQSCKSMSGQDYPRVCGGTDWLMTPDLVNQGLSPRVRGNHVRRMFAAFA